MSTLSSPFTSPKIKSRNTSGVTTRSGSRNHRNPPPNKCINQKQPQNPPPTSTTTTTSNQYLDNNNHGLQPSSSSTPKRQQRPQQQRRSTPRQRRTSNTSASKCETMTAPSPSNSISSLPSLRSRCSSRSNRLPLSPLRMTTTMKNTNIMSTRSGTGGGSKKIRKASNTGGSSITTATAGGDGNYKSPLPVRYDETKSPLLSQLKTSRGDNSHTTTDDATYSSGRRGMVKRRILQCSNTKPKKLKIFSPTPYVAPVTPVAPVASVAFIPSATSGHRSPLSVTFNDENKSPLLNNSKISNGRHSDGRTTADGLTTYASINNANSSGSKGENETMVKKLSKVSNITPKRKRIFAQFVYPQNVSPPRSEHIRAAYEDVMSMSNSIDNYEGETNDILSPLSSTATATATATMKTTQSHHLHHQKKLKIAGSDVISFEEVIIPCVIHRQNEALIKVQGKAQGHDDIDTKEKVLLCRATLKAIQRDTTFAVRICREHHEEEVRERRRDEEERLVGLREGRKRERSVERAKRVEDRKREEEEKRRLEEERKRIERVKVERRRRERKKNFPKNKELLREEAFLLTELARLEKAKSMWKDAGSILDRMEVESEKITNAMDVELDKVDGEATDESDIESLEKKHQAVVNNITISATRINDASSEVLNLVEKADVVRQGLYTKYKNDHKFQGYLGIKNPKALIRALAL